MSSGTQYELNPPPTDAISSVQFSPTSSKILVSCWDKFVYLYDANGPSDAQLVQKFEHRAPVLSVCFGEDDNVAYSGGLDWDVRRIDLTTGSQTVLSSHTAGVKSVVYSPSHQILISASWDLTLHIHHPSSPETQPSTIPLPNKPFALSSTSSHLVVAMSQRQTYIYDLPSLATLSSQSSQPPPNTLDLEPFQRRESSLKFMTRALACMPNGEGYASSSIEGRVAVEWFDASSESQSRKYAFKCHRQSMPASSISGGVADDSTLDDPDALVDVVYPVHALAFHPTYGTFASGGGDGFVALWDAVAKRRIRQYQRFPASIAALDFSNDGKMLVVGVSPGFEQGKEGEGEGEVAVFVRVLGDGEAKGKATKS